MNEILAYVDWVFRALFLLVVLFLMVIFWERKFSLFFGGKSSLRTKADHTLHSCFLTALCTVVFFIIGNILSDHIITLPMEKIALRRLFYFLGMVNLTFFFVSLFLLHAIRQCGFSNIARTVSYLMFIELSLYFIQLVVRGYLDISYSLLNSFVAASFFICNISAFIILISYPTKLFLDKKHFDLGNR
ncbi:MULTISPECIES: hypothetical protein [Pseudoalteromonas]|uniref:Uncharacterized protein n=1 Tax=Pseudoalteromonas luteoviolacea (strain 2ta16) TaxID=1353533 RepID=V4H311_PSEL2|nr:MULTISPECIES: hypothetical protein [Pseudoalteromonas]ESP91806.1 hypothetical protein PL2TA16_05297 [Pseudoalteromonas luteoviolacea 2ta16]KZN42152.1 hypothetical protein N483_11545 [Pseudoalteromonas luteoviolacea NCIMB 1944]MCG7547353.1 hypothetical protein [Pseudoalteromonas sp. Of7M-16]